MRTQLSSGLCLLLLLLCSARAAAQPGGCRWTYPISLECPEISGHTVFLGRVLSLTELEATSGNDAPTDLVTLMPRSRAVVAIEQLFKGEAGAVIELTMNRRCYGRIETGKRYIFNLGRDQAGNYYPAWSNALEDLPEGGEEKLLRRIRAVMRKERQSPILGTITNVERRHPLPGVVVVAEKGEEKFEARTDAEGRYEFSELPDGEYKVYPILSPALRPAENEQHQYAKPGQTTVINGAVCSTRLDFTALYVGVISGQIEDAEGKPFATAWATLWRFDDVTDSTYLYAEFARQVEPGAFLFTNVAPGRYLIAAYVPGDEQRTPGFYYPGVVYQKDAHVIQLAEGQSATGLIVTIPPPRKP